MLAPWTPQMKGKVPAVLNARSAEQSVHCGTSAGRPATAASKITLWARLDRLKVTVPPTAMSTGVLGTKEVPLVLTTAGTSVMADVPVTVVPSAVSDAVMVAVPPTEPLPVTNPEVLFTVAEVVLFDA